MTSIVPSVKAVKSNSNVILVILYGIICLCWDFQTYPLINDLDSSWNFAINYFFENNFLFGREIIFTYGPLGFLSYATNEGLTSGSILFKHFVHILYLGGFLYLILKINTAIDELNIRYSILKYVVKYFLLPFAFLKTSIFQNDFSPFIFVCIIYAYNLLLLSTGDSLQKSFRDIAFVGISSALLFYIKVSYGIFLVFFIIVLTVSFLRKSQYKSFFFLISVLSASLIIIYYSVDVQIFDYIKNSIPIIIGYKNSMQMDFLSIPFTTTIKYFIYFSSFFCIVSILLFLFIRNYKKIMATESSIYLLLINCAALYFFFSYSFTRGIGTLIFAMPVVIFVFFCLTFIQSRTFVSYFFYTTLFILFIHFGFYMYFLVHNYKGGNSKNISDYQAKMINRDSTLARFRNETFDVYPYLCSVAYYNELDYKPRPIFQTYSAYTVDLDSINADFYNKKEVDNIIVHYSNIPNWGGADLLGNSIDRRYFMFDDPLTKLQIVNNYSYIGMLGDSLFLMHKNGNSTAPMSLLFEHEQVGKMNENIFIDSSRNSVLFYTCQFNLKPWSKFFSLLFNPPNLQIEIELEDGEIFHHKVVGDLVNSPTLISHYCHNFLDFLNLMHSESSTSKDRVHRIKFYSDYPGYINDFTVKFYSKSH